MKITSVDILELTLRNAQHWRPIVCRINTDEGFYGYGEAAMAYGTGASAAFGMIQDLSGLIIGMDPLDNEVIWDYLYKKTLWGQNGGVVVFAGISAIDIALWDIKGKFFGVPVHKLLGGKCRDKLRSYASQLQFGWDHDLNLASATEDYVMAAKQAVSEGFDALKFDFLLFDREGTWLSSEDTTQLVKPHYLEMVEERIAAVRRAVGPSIDIILENHAHTDRQSAAQIARKAEPYDILFLEEPTTSTPKLARFMKDSTTIPLAAGERIYTRWDYAPYLEEGLLAVIQPDLGTCGGFTEVKKICDMAYIYDTSVQAHVCASPLSTAAAIQLEAVIPNFCIHEHHTMNRLAQTQELCVHDYQPVDGYLAVPDEPGIGNELSEYALQTARKVTVATRKEWKLENTQE